jgi:hypothetical protein
VAAGLDGTAVRVAVPALARQTPYRGHPVFVAQHATATGCRACLERWHDISRGHELRTDEQAYVVDVVCRWIERQMAGGAVTSRPAGR